MMKELTLGTIQNILKEFAQNGVLFSNERQFQLELAFKLKEYYDVYLEMLDYSNGEKKYVDIVVKVGNNEFVAIELKYTTRDRNILYKTSSRTVYTFKQGAGDIRRFHFLKDVERLEKLLKKTDVFEIEGAKVIKGFAIIMTNDNPEREKPTQYARVALNEGREIPGKIYENKPLTIDTSGYQDKKIELESSYVCKWQDYELNNTKIRIDNAVCEKDYETYPFRYMIFEISS